MNNLSPELNAIIRALSGESDLDAVHPALGNCFLAHIIALAPGAHSIVRAVAALAGELPDLLDARIVADPALHNAIAHLIGMNGVDHILSSWASVTSADWGRIHAEALFDAVKRKTCEPRVTAALIGPCNPSARLLRYPYDISFAIRRWGQLTPDEPTAWMLALSVEDRDRLINTMQRVPSAVSMCLPWLPPDMANQMKFSGSDLASVFDAFTATSPTARAQHASIVQRLVEQAQSMHLDSLTRLACTMQSKTVWQRVQTLIHEDPDAAYRVVAAAPWDALAEPVRTAILEHANQSDICAAIAAARGRKYIERITTYPAAAFFAALDPKVWDALPPAEQRRWRDALWKEHAHLAVRSLGLRPEFLAKAALNNSFVRAAQRHAPDAAALYWALLPVALRNVHPDAVITLLTEMPTPPPDPGAFFCIFREKSDPAVTVSARAALRTGRDLELSVVMQHCAHGKTTISEVCTTLRHALMGRSREDLEPIISLLDDHIRDALMPDTQTLVERLAHPDRRDALRQTLARLTSLPPEVAIPTQYALYGWGVHTVYAHDAATAVAFSLRGHGDVFLELVDGLADDCRTAILPLPEDPAQASALRELACDDPPTAQRLAHALHGEKWRAAITTLLTTPQRHAEAIWRSLTKTERDAIALAAPAAPPCIGALAERDPIVALALAAVQSDNADMREAGVDALADRLDALRAIWLMLSPEIQQTLQAHPSFARGVADLPQTHNRITIRRILRR